MSGWLQAVVVVAVMLVALAIMAWAWWREPAESVKQREEFARAWLELERSLGEVLRPPLERLVRLFARPFDPDWCVHPGATLQDWLDEQGLDLEDGAARCMLSTQEFEGIVEGLTGITPRSARCLAIGTGSSAEFWLNREQQFRDALAAGKTWLR